MKKFIDAKFKIVYYLLLFFQETDVSYLKNRK